MYSQLENTTLSAGRSTNPNATFDADFCDAVKKECGKHGRLDIKERTLSRVFVAIPDVDVHTFAQALITPAGF